MPDEGGFVFFGFLSALDWGLAEGVLCDSCEPSEGG